MFPPVFVVRMKRACSITHFARRGVVSLAKGLFTVGAASRVLQGGATPLENTLFCSKRQSKSGSGAAISVRALRKYAICCVAMRAHRWMWPMNLRCRRRWGGKVRLANFRFSRRVQHAATSNDTGQQSAWPSVIAALGRSRFSAVRHNDHFGAKQNFKRAFFYFLRIYSHHPPEHVVLAPLLRAGPREDLARPLQGGGRKAGIPAL